MGYNSFLKSPKEEEQEVPDSIIIQLSNNKDDFEADDEVDVMDDLERILGIDDEEKFSQRNSNGGQLSWEFMDWDEFRNAEEEDEEEEREQKVLFEEENKCFFEEESYCNNYKGSVIKSETSVGFWDDDFKSVSLNLNLNLNLNYQEVLDAWSDRGSLWAEDYSLSLASNGCYMGEVPVMEEEKARREASVLRYKEKRQNRLFSKKIRYQVRKLNADKRPRLKGRFVKRVS